MVKSNVKFDIPVLIRFVFNENNSNHIEQEIGLRIENKFKKDEKSNKATVILDVSIGEPYGNSPYFVNVVYSANFVWDDSISNIDDYLNINAPALLYGYTRTLLSMVLSNTRHNRLDLPFMNFTKNKD